MEQTHQEREIENAGRIANAKQYASEGWQAVGQEDQQAIAYALLGLLEIAIVRANVRSYEPPF